MKYRKSINENNREVQKMNSGKPDEQVYQNKKRLQEEKKNKRPIRNYTKAYIEHQDELDDIEDFYGR